MTTKVAKDKRPADQKRRVWKGQAEQTKSGLKKADLARSKSKQIVSRRRKTSASKNRCLSAWRNAADRYKASKGMSKKSFLIVRRGTKAYKTISKNYRKSRPKKCMKK